MGHVGHFKPTHMFHPSSATPLDAYSRTRSLCLFAPCSHPLTHRHQLANRRPHTRSLGQGTSASSTTSRVN